MNLTRHNLAFLTSLSVLLEERNVTRAAVKLHLTQSALSAQLSRLRDLFDDPLLIPSQSGKGMVLTARAEHLRLPLRQALQALEVVVGDVPTFDPAKSERTFVIACNDNAAAIITPRLLPLLHAASPVGIRVSIRAIEPIHLPALLERGEIDIALGSLSIVGGMSHELLLEEDCKMAQRIDHPRGIEPPTLDEYLNLEHVVVSGAVNSLYGFIDKILAKKGYARRVGISVPYYSIVPLLLQSSDLVCVLPSRFLSRYEHSLTALPLPLEVQNFRLYSVWHPRLDKDLAHTWLRRQLRLSALS
ncbi:LysR family transcriptional regulator [uncultured Caballeronia sp.]|uniref:LysR family transcriptional regulator n=1 Tax=uncultured Caballeronia sp. TaxID=1827198 RepID=UPI0035CA5CED